MSETLVLVGLAGLFWFWLSAMRSKEIARLAGKRASEQAEAQFLDDTVELIKLRPRRAANGRLAWYREYRFEYTRDSNYRCQGLLAMLGTRVLFLNLDP